MSFQSPEAVELMSKAMYKSSDSHSTPRTNKSLNNPGHVYHKNDFGAGSMIAAGNAGDPSGHSIAHNYLENKAGKLSKCIAGDASVDALKVLFGSDIASTRAK